MAKRYTREADDQAVFNKVRILGKDVNGEPATNRTLNQRFQDDLKNNAGGTDRNRRVSDQIANTQYAKWFGGTTQPTMKGKVDPSGFLPTTIIRRTQPSSIRAVATVDSLRRVSYGLARSQKADIEVPEATLLMRVNEEKGSPFPERLRNEYLTSLNLFNRMLLENAGGETDNGIFAQNHDSPGNKLHPWRDRTDESYVRRISPVGNRLEVYQAHQKWYTDVQFSGDAITEPLALASDASATVGAAVYVVPRLRLGGIQGLLRQMEQFFWKVGEAHDRGEAARITIQNTVHVFHPHQSKRTIGRIIQNALGLDQVFDELHSVLGFNAADVIAQVKVLKPTGFQTDKGMYLQEEVMVWNYGGEPPDYTYDFRPFGWFKSTPRKVMIHSGQFYSEKLLHRISMSDIEVFVRSIADTMRSNLVFHETSSNAAPKVQTQAARMAVMY